jgi:hypothetical protein
MLFSGIFNMSDQIWNVCSLALDDRAPKALAAFLGIGGNGVPIQQGGTREE